MNLLFDGRALQSSIQSGVPRVASWLFHSLASPSEHSVTVFTTGWNPVVIPAQAGIHFRHVHLRIPNKLLHLSLFLFSWPKLDLLVSRQTGETYDAVFLPNLHFFSFRAPFALLVHDLSFLVLPQFFSPFERFVHFLKRPLPKLRDAKWLFAVSKSTARDISRYAGREDIAVIDISGAAAPRSFAAAQDDGGARWDFVFLSTTEPRKNLENAILGFLQMDSRLRGNDRLLIIGAVTREGKALQKKYSHEKSVVWLGVVNDETRTTILSHGKALLYPSQFEGFGLPLVEAMRLGTPIITSQRTSMPEVAPHALLVDPERAESIRLALGIVSGFPITRARVSGMTNESSMMTDTSAETANIVYTILAK